ncbi:MAG: nucleotide exchange factor GrpE [Chitinophagia bacterium]|nr:nucleotide exchange factor GrpE [Chitinophagia bacterium]
MSETNNEIIPDNVENTDKVTPEAENEFAAAPETWPEDTAAQEEALWKLEQEIAELKDKHLRLIAEFDNFRRRIAREKIEMSATAGKEIIQALLVVLDDMGRAEKQLETSEDIPAIKEGIALVFNKMRTVLQTKGLKAMETGDKFDADLHEAITEVPVPGKEGKIIDVIEPGYYLNDKLIRFAKVVVGK